MPQPFYLVGDVGATNARLAITASSGRTIEWHHEIRVADAKLSSFDVALDALFAASPISRHSIRGGCLGVAGPIRGRQVRFTNRDWIVDADAIAARLGGVPVTLVNDLAAAATGIDALDPRDFVLLQDRPRVADGVRLVIGAGTGLGVAYAVPCGGRHRVIASEGGHAGFAPANSRQRWVAGRLRGQAQRIEAEQIVSGAGLERIYAALRDEEPGAESRELRTELDHGAGPAAITRHALEHHDPLATAALDLFIECYGTVAGDHALAVLPAGGVFVVGGIAGKILPRLAAGGFVRAFTAKSAFSALAESFPIAVVTNEHLGLAGATLIAAGSAAPSP